MNLTCLRAERNSMTEDIERVLLTQEEIQAKVASMDFMAVSSYRGTCSTGAVKINKDLSEDIAGRHLILVEDILDSGVTLNYLKNYLQVRQPASIHVVTLLDKPARRRADIYADYSCFEVPDAFVVGYGLDYNECYRNLPYIGILKPKIYS